MLYENLDITSSASVRDAVRYLYTFSRHLLVHFTEYFFPPALSISSGNREFDTPNKQQMINYQEYRHNRILAEPSLYIIYENVHEYLVVFAVQIMHLSILYPR